MTATARAGIWTPRGASRTPPSWTSEKFRAQRLFPSLRPLCRHSRPRAPRDATRRDMAPATSDANENKWAELNKARAESMKWKLLVPLLYAPTLAPHPYWPAAQPGPQGESVRRGHPRRPGARRVHHGTGQQRVNQTRVVARRPPRAKTKSPAPTDTPRPARARHVRICGTIVNDAADEPGGDFGTSHTTRSNSQRPRRFPPLHSLQRGDGRG